jgi:copper resistance protein B
MIKRTSAFIFAVFAIIAIAESSARAQQAPAFSNDLMMDDQTYVYFIADRLEYYSTAGANSVQWDLQSYVGNNMNKLWIKAEGEALLRRKEGEMEFQGLYNRAITSYFSLQTGLRYDIAYHQSSHQSRGLAVIGLQGMAPYFFEVDGNLFISEAGNISANLEAEYDMPITQRLWAQPRIATSVAVQEVPEWGVGSGWNNIQLGLRFRYEIKREMAPYIGISWNRKLGETADFAQLESEQASTFGLVGGLRMWL